jgi:uncharacterized protein
VKIRVDDIRESEKRVQFAEDPAEVNEALRMTDAVDYQLAEAPKIDVSYYRGGSDLFFRGHFDAKVAGTCARCLERYPFSVGGDFSFVLKPASTVAREPKGAEEDVSLSFYQGDEVDLSPLLREAMLLSLPTRPLCRDDCPGLCAHCGANLKNGACGCEEAPIGHSRFEVLRSLRRS